MTQWQDDFWSYMVKFYPDLERGESASKTGRTHIPPRLFKEAVHLNQQKDMLLELLADINPLNAKKRAAEIEALLENCTPGVEKMRTRLKKYDAAYKELKAEIAALEKLRKLVDNIPAEILALYNDANLGRKETLSHK